MSPEALAAIIGVFMPLVVSLLKRATWPNWAKLALTGIVSLGVGALSAWVSGQVDIDSNPERIFTSAAAAFTAATAIYKAWFVTTPANDTLTKALW